MSIVISGTTGIDLGHTPASNVTDLEVEGNLNITGTGKRITGDFSNATEANRLAFQTSTLNGTTSLGVIPNGTAQTALLRVSNSSDLTNCNVIDIVAAGTSTRLQTAGFGTNPHTPLEFWVSGNEKMRIDTAGNVLLPGYGYISRLSGNGKSYYNSFYESNGTYDNNCISSNFLRTGTNSGTISSSLLGTAEVQLITGGSNKGTVNINTGVVNTIPTTRLSIDSAGNVLVVSPTGGLGYGTGSGGTVTQLTSKGTTVTLNKPTGQIIMNNSALAAGASITFQFVNSLISSTDNMLVHLREYGGTTDAYIVTVTPFIYGGGGYITLINRSGISLSDTVVLKFNILKGANA